MMSLVTSLKTTEFFKIYELVFFREAQLGWRPKRAGSQMVRIFLRQFKLSAECFLLATTVQFNLQIVMLFPNPAPRQRIQKLYIPPASVCGVVIFFAIAWTK